MRCTKLLLFFLSFVLLFNISAIASKHSNNSSAGTALTGGTPTVTQEPFSTTGEEFVGPFANWVNVRSYGAKGDGIADDTAAIQAAINAILAKPGPVLWIPTGTYRITDTLRVSNSQGFGIIGEDPTTTSLVWDGANGGTMLVVQASSHTRIKRLTWNGAAVADTGHRYEFDGQAGYFPTGDAEDDEVFVNLNYGVRVGWAAELMIDRTQFSRISEAGVSVENWNALDIWVRDSTFTDCRVGLTNTNLAGHFHVYNSLFQRSQEADMEMANTSYFSERGNTSVGSRAFFVARAIGANPAQITLQDNLIINAQSTPIVIGNQGPLMLFDNTFLDQNGATFPVVEANNWVPTDVFSIGNKFDRPNVLYGGIGRNISVDDKQIDPTVLAIALSGPATFQPNLHRAVFEITPGSSATTIQAALNKAAKLSGSRPVVHLESGVYSLDKMLVIAGGSDLQLVGDGNGVTFVDWVGKGAGPMVQLQSPSRAAIKDIAFDALDKVQAVQVQVNDAPGSRVRFSDLETNLENQKGIAAEGIDQAVVEILSGQIYGVVSSISANGGQLSAAGLTTFGRLSGFGTTTGTSSTNGTTFSVTSGAALTIFDNWRDTGASSPMFINLQSSSGHVALDGGVIGTVGSTPFTLQSFVGDVAMVGYEFNGALSTAGSGTELRFMALGVTGDGDCDFWQDTATPVQGVLAMSTCRLPSSGGQLLPDVGAATDAYLRTMLSRIRHLRPQPLGAVAPGLSDFRMDSVYVKRATTAIDLVPASSKTPGFTGYSLADGNGNELAPVSTGSGIILGLRKLSKDAMWNILRQADGSYALVALSNGAAVAGDLSVGDAANAESWIIRPDGTGRFTLQETDSGAMLSLDSLGVVGLRQSGFGWLLQPK